MLGYFVPANDLRAIFHNVHPQGPFSTLIADAREPNPSIRSYAIERTSDENVSHLN